MATYFEEHDLKPEIEMTKSNTKQNIRLTLKDYLTDPNTEIPNNEFIDLANFYLQVIQQNADASELDQLVLLDNLVAELIEQGLQHKQGPPAASAKFIKDLSIVSKEKIEKNARCSICREDLDREEVDSKVTILPCKHYFDLDCVVPWLKLHNTCPVCRAEVPTDDQEWLRKKHCLVPYEDYDPDYMYS
ncbi:hypothetical protein K502DRAFT_362029 [Neoconidiobolus thromboides FSU 785]|nr:hypothetical protein K502DRAFT_362029 [Neoconidiobolus thromboides FSU 785]